MQQNDLNRSVARVTGETVTTIKRLGFVLDDPDHRDDSDVETIDWDLLEARRYAGRAVYEQSSSRKKGTYGSSRPTGLPLRSENPRTTSAASDFDR